METKIVWLAVPIALYWTYCLFWGVKAARSSRTAADYFLAGRGISFSIFIPAVTASSLAGAAFIGHPDLLYASGFQYALVAFHAIAIPLTGVLFMKRQWILGKHFGFVTPGDMYSFYFRSEQMRILAVIVALVFAIAFLGLLLRASGYLLNVVTDGQLSEQGRLWMLAAVLFFYVGVGGLRAVAHVGALQGLLFVIGLVSIGLIVLNAVGGFDMFNRNIALLAENDAKLTSGGYSHYLAIPGVIQVVADSASAEGGTWTGAMILTSVLALMGLQSAPTFSMWAFASRSAAPFAPQQVWASAFAIGLLCLIFTTVQGIGGHFLGADLDFAKNHPERLASEAASTLQANFFRASHGEALATLEIDDERLRAMTEQGLSLLGESGSLPTIVNLATAGNDTAKRLMSHQASLGDVPVLTDMSDRRDRHGIVVPQLIAMTMESAPWLAGFLAVGVLAALQAPGAAHLSTASTMLTRDLVRRFFLPRANEATQKLLGLIGAAVILLLALLIAGADNDMLFLLGGLAFAFGLQLWPALIAICYWPFLTRQGVVLGLIAGLIAVMLTSQIGVAWLGITSWGAWPLTVHAAAWGLLVNAVVAIGISAIAREDRLELERKTAFHEVLREHAALPAARRALLPLAWIVTLCWFFFAVGPGAVLGNWIFGDPAKATSWVFAIPSIWAWQILFWVLGVFMMWFLAYAMQLSTAPRTEIETLADDIGELEPPLKG